MEGGGQSKHGPPATVALRSKEGTTKLTSDPTSIAARGRQTDHGHVTIKGDDQDSSGAYPKQIDQNGERDVADLGHEADMLSISPKPPSLSVDQVGPGVKLEAPIPNGLSRDEDYTDPTPKTPRQEVSPSRPSLVAAIEGRGDEGPTSELQSIMDQFDDADATGEETDRKDSDPIGSHLTTPLQHPPRRSSLEPSSSTRPQQLHEPRYDPESGECQFDLPSAGHESPSGDTADKLPPMRTSSLQQSAPMIANNANHSSSPNASKTLPKLPPPDPDPEPDLPFDFHRFLEQLRHRTADPVAKFLRSFLVEFGKKQWMVHEQEKIIHDFLTFIANKMAHCEVWRGVSDAEFDNAKEGMEKLVMNRLYSQTFSPAIPVPAPVPGPKAKRKNAEQSSAPGRKGQHQEDIERDEILGQKVRIYGWVQEEHLDIPPVGDNGRRFLFLAQQG